MSYKMLCKNPDIHIGDEIITEVGKQFTVEDKKTRDDLVRVKAAVDITNGVPVDKETSDSLLQAKLSAETARADKLAKELALLRQELKNQPKEEKAILSDEEIAILEDNLANLVKGEDENDAAFAVRKVKLKSQLKDAKKEADAVKKAAEGGE